MVCLRAMTYALLGVILSACQHEQPNVIYMPDMVYTKATKPQDGKMRVPPSGTIPQGLQTYPYPQDPEAAAAHLVNPLRPTAQTLARGEHIFNTFCIVCHGKLGEGNGSIIPKYPRPPSLQSEKIRQIADGGIYHIITRGQNLMPSYAAQIDPTDRWAVIHYVRVLQRSKHPSESDLKHFIEED